MTEQSSDPAPLTDAERAEIQGHTKYGREYVERTLAKEGISNRTRVFLSRWLEEQKAPERLAADTRAERQTRASEQQARYAKYSLPISILALIVAAAALIADVTDIDEARPAPTVVETSPTDSDASP
ncbi:MAG: hypothetical protein ABL879_15820 [Devosia sp.]